MAALRGAQTLAYLSDMSRVLRSGRLALGPLITLVQRIPKLGVVCSYFLVRFFLKRGTLLKLLLR